MRKDYFLQTPRLGFSHWEGGDLGLARSLWGEPQVTRYICASGVFTEDEIRARLATEIERQKAEGVQYWPTLRLIDGVLIGCCGLRPHAPGSYELGFHLRPDFWGQGYATEAATAVIGYAFGTLGAESLFAGHNPNNLASAAVMKKLGFTPIGAEFYPPTGLYHPSYTMSKEDWKERGQA